MPVLVRLPRIRQPVYHLTKQHGGHITGNCETSKSVNGKRMHKTATQEEEEGGDDKLVHRKPRESGYARFGGPWRMRLAEMGEGGAHGRRARLG